MKSINKKKELKMKLNWVTIQVSDLQKSLSFYTNLLNLDIAERFGTSEHQIVMLGKKDEPKIELICEPGKKIENSENGVSIGLEADNLEQLIQVLQENGYHTMGPISPNPNIRFYFVKDPDGYTVQLARQK